MRTNSAPTSKTKVAAGRAASKVAAGSRSRVNSPARAVSSLDNRADNRSRVKAVSRINAENCSPSWPPAVPGVFSKSQRRQS
jgi:hypothetical protein